MKLTTKQKVAKMIVEAKSNAQIAAELGKSAGYVRNMISELYRETGVIGPNRVALANALKAYTPLPYHIGRPLPPLNGVPEQE